MNWLQCLNRTAIYIVVAFLGSLWTILCFVVVNGRVCCEGCMASCAEGRKGGCHDWPLIREGCKESYHESMVGWSYLCSWITPDDDYYDEEMGQDNPQRAPGRAQSIVREPDPV